MTIRVAAFARYGPEAASTRQRFVQYVAPLRSHEIELEIFQLLPDKYVRSLSSGSPFSKLEIASRYARRIREARALAKFDAVWLYMEFLPYMPAGAERLLLGRGKPLVVDWDDAFFLRYRALQSPIGRGLLGNKLETIVARADAVTCGNAMLRDYASQYSDRALLVPTVVDTDIWRPADVARTLPTVIGWIGSPSSWHNVRPILARISALCAQKNATFVVVGAGKVNDADRLPNIRFVEWTMEGEVAAVQSFDIGIMPLIDEPFERGKSGYKLVQYMACGLPCIASPVGANCDIIIEGENGLFASSVDEWAGAIETLIDDPALAARMGEAGRQRTIDRFSLRSQVPVIADLFQSLSQQPPRNPGPATPRPEIS